MQDFFAIIYDPRNPSYVKHKLSDILIIIMSAVLCGLDELCTITEFAQNKASFFDKEFGIKSIPSKPTFSRILNIINPKEVAEKILELMKDRITGKEEVVAIDGKAIRSTSKTNNPHSALQIITAYLTENGVILGQEKIHEKTNEIPAVQDMLKYLNIKGKTVTADAMHCQKETCKLINQKKADYLIGLKRNQKSLYEDVKLFFENPPNDSQFEIYETNEKNSGRIEKRICKKLTDITWLQNRHNWPNLKTVVSIERTVIKANKTTKETSYYIASGNISAKKSLEIAREHWEIESMHWLLDVVFSEDECRFLNENAHLTLNILRKFALMKHKNFLNDNNKKKKISIKGNMLKALLNDKLLLDIIDS